MIKAKTEFGTCKEVFVSSTSKLFELLFEDIPIRHTEYVTFLADKGVYIVDSDSNRLLRLECQEGKKVLLKELHDGNIEPQTVLDTYLNTLFAVFERANIREKTTLTYYTGEEFVEPVDIKVIDHPLGFMRGSFTLFDELISKNCRGIRLDRVKEPPALIYDPLEAFDNRISNSSILIFEKDSLKELAVMSFENFLKVKEIFIHTTHFHINAAFFGYLKFKIRKMQGI